MIVQGVLLSPAQAAVLSRLVGHGVRRARASGESIGRDTLALVEQLEVAARAYRATGVGNTALPTLADGDELPDAVSVKEAAALIGVSDRRVRQFIEQGRLSARKIGGTWSVHTNEVHELARRRRTAPTVP